MLKNDLQLRCELLDLTMQVQVSSWEKNRLRFGGVEVGPTYHLYSEYRIGRY